MGTPVAKTKDNGQTTEFYDSETGEIYNNWVQSGSNPDSDPRQAYNTAGTGYNQRPGGTTGSVNGGGPGGGMPTSIPTPTPGIGGGPQNTGNTTNLTLPPMPGPLMPESPATSTPATSSTTASAMAGLQAAAPEQPLGEMGTMLNAPGSLRQGIGVRIPPQLNPVLAGLKRIY